MSANNLFKQINNRCRTKRKKFELPFLFNLEQIDRKYNSQSFEKKDMDSIKLNDFDLININTNLNLKISSKTPLKPKYNKCRTKLKKFKFPFLFNLQEIDRKLNYKSCEKKEIHYIKLNNELTNILKRNNIDDLKLLPLKNIDYIYSAWKSTKEIFENFEKNILNKKDFEIDFETLDIKTKNEKACNELKDEKFWILYSEFLIKNNKIKNSKDFLKVINIAFSYLELEYKLLIYYYLEKIKKLNPIIKDGKIEDKDIFYIDLLDGAVKNRIKTIKAYLSSDIKLISNKKYKKN